MINTAPGAVFIKPPNYLRVLLSHENTPKVVKNHKWYLLNLLNAMNTHISGRYLGVVGRSPNCLGVSLSGSQSSLETLNQLVPNIYI